MKNIYDVNEMEFFRKYVFWCFKVVVEVLFVVLIWVVLELDEMVLDYVLFGEYELFDVEVEGVLVMYLVVLGYG